MASASQAAWMRKSAAMHPAGVIRREKKAGTAHNAPMMAEHDGPSS